jgi:hypothetical protein
MFKTEELWKEWEARKLDPRLYGIIMAQARFVYATMYPSIMEITSIYREKLTSVHGHWRGVDWLMRDRPPTTHMMIVDWTNKFFPYQKAGHDTCLYHNAGSGLHMHNQVCSIEEVR